MFNVTLRVLNQELAAHGSCRCHIVVAVIADPLGQMVGDIESRWGGDCIFVVDEIDGRNVVWVPVAFVAGQGDHVGAQEIAMGEHKLQEKVN